MFNHDLARFTMIMASVPWFRTLGTEVNGDRGGLSELVKNATQIVIFLPHPQINLWGRKVKNCVLVQR